jgi:hypothetical protein
MVNRARVRSVDPCDGALSVVMSKMRENQLSVPLDRERCGRLWRSVRRVSIAPWLARSGMGLLLRVLRTHPRPCSLSANTQMVFELIQTRLKCLNLNIERVKLSLVVVGLPRILIIENTNLITEDLDSLLDPSEISGNCCRTTLFTPVDLVNTGGHGNETDHSKND